MHNNNIHNNIHNNNINNNNGKNKEKLHANEEEEREKEEGSWIDCDPNKVPPIGAIWWILQADLKRNWMKIA